MYDLVRYTADKADEWNQFIAASKNGTFLFHRNYMDYHRERFADHSLMVYRNGKLYALLPGNEKDATWVSHGGLTYGGLVMGSHCRAAEVREVFVLLNDYLARCNIRKVIYKHVPWIYASLPSEEDLFAVTNVCHAAIRSRDMASVVFLHQPPFVSTLRKRGVKKALKNGLDVEESGDYDAYWRLLVDTLQRRHHASPVHSLPEILMLHSRFPDHIRLFVVKKGQDMIGGTVVYICGKTVKTQYIATNEEGRMSGALDLLFLHLISKFTKEGMRYFDFGTSNLVGSDELNDTLIFQKEGFGARAVCYDTYEWTL